MKVEIRLTQDAYEPYAVIYTNEITDEVRETADSIHASNRIVIANEDERSIVLSARDIYMIRIEDAAVWIHCKEKKYSAKKRLCDIEKALGEGFMRISKTTLVNLKYIAYVEPYFNGTMLLLIKNGSKDSISRKYLPKFKEYLGL